MRWLPPWSIIMRKSGSVFRAYARKRFRRALTFMLIDDQMEKNILSGPVKLHTIDASACFAGS
jgi:hypothetical protein